MEATYGMAWGLLPKVTLARRKAQGNARIGLLGLEQESKNGTFQSADTEDVALWVAGKTITVGTAATGIVGIDKFETKFSSGTLEFPACSIKMLDLSTSGGTVQANGDMTFTSELEVNSGTTFNANGNTINFKALDINGTLDLSNSTAKSTDANSDYIDFTGGALLSGNTTIEGYGTGTNRTEFTAPAGDDIEVVGDVKWLDFAANSDLTVVGSVIDCDYESGTTGGNFRQWHHTLDTQQLLDADSAGDDDLRLTKPALDNSHELMTG